MTFVPGHSTPISSLFQNRDVLRAGWLKYIPFAERPSDEHKFWAVFAVYDESTPYLEFYQKRQWHMTNLPLTDGPVSKHSLQNCRHISSVITPNESHFEFNIKLDTHVIRLSAERDEVMFDWINILKTKLILMGILIPTENVYSQSPFPASQPSPSHPGHSEAIDSNVLYETISFGNLESISQNLSHLSLENGSSPNRVLPLPEEGPPPYEQIFVQSGSSQHQNNNQRPVSFRESQVEILRNEIIMPALSLKARKKDCLNAIAFVDVNRVIFIAGWKQKEHPHLHNTFHIGDQLISINENHFESASEARNFIKYSHTSSLNFVVRRTPFGRVFCLIRTEPSDDTLGIVRDGGTAKILHITPNSSASKAGLHPYCEVYEADEDGQSIWCLTEINNRSLNLFFKGNEISGRLNAIGREVSVLVQPYNFVRKMRKQLKTYSNYKDYIVQ